MEVANFRQDRQSKSQTQMFTSQQLDNKNALLYIAWLNNIKKRKKQKEFSKMKRLISY